MSKSAYAVCRADGTPIRLGDPDTPREGTYLCIDGVWTLVRQGAAKKRDSKHIRSFSSGVGAQQVDEMNARFGHLGVKYEPGSGDAIYEDRRAKLRVLKARGYHDLEEVRG